VYTFVNTFHTKSVTLVGLLVTLVTTKQYYGLLWNAMVTM